jgi:hypothetical protein
VRTVPTLAVCVTALDTAAWLLMKVIANDWCCIHKLPK